MSGIPVARLATGQNDKRIFGIFRKAQCLSIVENGQPGA